MALGQVQERPAYVTFERIPVEDRALSIANGHYTTKDVEFVFVTPPGSKDRIPREVSVWLEELNAGAREERIDPRTVEQYKSLLEHWRRGQAAPLFGTPIKGWPILSPAQQQVILQANVLTVEDLAQANGEALQRIGIGGQEMRQKAISWLDSAKNIGQVAMQSQQVSAENTLLKEQVSTLMKQVQDLTLLVSQYVPLSARPQPAQQVEDDL